MKKTLFKQPLLTNLKKRKEKLYDFYYLTYGPIIRKRRLELKRTQEDVACSICSNTYISKAENNQVVIGDDQLNLIMERLDISEQEFANPEQLIYYLDKIIQYYYYRDLDSYEAIIQKINGYHFHALVELFKLGHQILNKKYDQASYTYNQLLDYLNALDDIAFEVFLIFSADLSLHMNQLHLAKYLIDSVYLNHLDYKELKPMYLFSKFRIYGRLNFPMQTMEVYHQLITIAIDTSNPIILNDLMIYKAIFNELHDKNHDIKYLELLDQIIDPTLLNEYLLIKAFKTDHPKTYVDQMKGESSFAHFIGLYLCARQALDQQNQKRYDEVIQLIESHEQYNQYQIDFSQLLKLEKGKEWTFYKDYLVNPCLKLAKEKQSIFLIHYVSKKIASVLESNNRYKDALNYLNQANKHINKLRYQQS